MKYIFLIIFSLNIFAVVNIDNNDNKSYNLFIEENNNAEHTAIAAKTKSLACKKSCKITIKKNKNSIKAKDGVTVIIKNSKLFIKKKK